MDEPTELARALGRALRVLRTERGMSRRNLADKAGISYSYLSEIEKGDKEPSSKVLSLLADALGLRPHELMEAAEVRRGGTAPAVDLHSRSRPDAPAALAAEGRWFHAAPSGPDTHLPAGRGRGRAPEDDLRELTEVFLRLRGEDRERVLDLARRLAS